MRICHKCEEEKPLTDFYKSKANKCGRQYACKECKKEQSKKYYRENLDYYTEYDKAWRKDNPDYKREYNKAYFQDNKEESMTYHRRWREDNPEKYRSIMGRARSRRRAREAKVINDLTMEEWIEVSNRFNNQCAYCENNTDITLDHVIPIFKGGGHTKSNVVPACMSCNASKQARDVEEWYSKQDFYDENNLNKIIEENE